MSERLKALLASKDMGLAAAILATSAHGFWDGKLTAHQALALALVGLVGLAIGEALAALRAALVKDGAPAPAVEAADQVDPARLADSVTTAVMVHLPEVSVDKVDALRDKIQSTIHDHISVQENS